MKEPDPIFRCDSLNQVCKTRPDPDCAPDSTVVWKCGHCDRSICSLCEGTTADDLCDPCWANLDPTTVAAHAGRSPVEIGVFTQDEHGTWRYTP